MRGLAISILTGLTLAAAPAAQAQDQRATPPAKPQAYQDLMACKALADPAARLACYDNQVGKLEQATASGAVVVTDRASVREARKGLFGFKLPSLGLFGSKSGDGEEEITEIAGTVAQARTFGYGAWRITLEDGSTWEQVDDARLVFDPARGDKIRIYRGALGTYRMNVAGQRAIKVRRVE